MDNIQKANILYVDDETNNLTSFMAAFRRHYNIYTAESARKGMEILKNHPIHVIITDQRMPEMSGIQFLEAIMPDYPEAVRMIMTGFSDVDAIIKAINNGRVYRYITKPWDEVELKITIDSAVRLYQLEQKNKDLIFQLNNEVVQQKRIMNIFQKYVPLNVLNDAFADAAENSIIYGENRIISILFADIRDFTALSARLDSRVVVSFLNDYFSLMSNCIHKHKGVVNKFLGDGIMALFGAPVSYMDNQSNAVFCAIEMIELLKTFNEEHASLIGKNIFIGIGINTGDVITGNIGSNERIEYTVIGDTVNVASRIEGLTKERPNSILISESTYLSVNDKVLVEELPLQSIKGKEEKIKVYCVLGKSINPQ